MAAFSSSTTTARRTTTIVVCAALRDRVHTLRSTTNTEVVLRAWSEWGPDFLDRVEGMCGVAL